MLHRILYLGFALLVSLSCSRTDYIYINLDLQDGQVEKIFEIECGIDGYIDKCLVKGHDFDNIDDLSMHLYNLAKNKGHRVLLVDMIDEPNAVFLIPDKASTDSMFDVVIIWPDKEIIGIVDSMLTTTRWPDLVLADSAEESQ